METVTTALIAEWERGTAAQRVAARLAMLIDAGKVRRPASPSNLALASEAGCSIRTAINAKTLLAEYGILTKEQGLYVITADKGFLAEADAPATR